MCACEWNYTCPKCKGVTEHDDWLADFGPETVNFADLLAQAEADARTIPTLQEWER